MIGYRRLGNRTMQPRQATAVSPAADVRCIMASIDKLFMLLNGGDDEDDIFGTICVINKIVWVVVLLKWMNFEIGV